MANMNVKKVKTTELELKDRLVAVRRVTKVTKGGRHFRFAATVVVGDRKGKVGLGTGKANEVPDKNKKAVTTDGNILAYDANYDVKVKNFSTKNIRNYYQYYSLHY